MITKTTVKSPIRQFPCKQSAECRTEQTRRFNSLPRLLILLAAASLCVILCSCDPVLSLNQKYAYTSFQIELGEPVSDDIAEYVDLTALSPEEASFVRDNSRVLFDGKDDHGESFAKPGEHTLTLEYRGRLYRKYDILITDEQPPVFTRAENIYVIQGIPTEIDYDSMFDAEDNSGDVKITINKKTVDFNQAGRYKVKASAEDSSGNKAQTKAYVIVQKPEYGIRGTYVYVDIERQHLSYFVDDVVVLDCPVVTGNIYGGHSTPRGTFALQYKARNMKLRGRENNGDEYESFVNYWMPFIGSEYGMHDATWRSNFGGSIYMGGGSHGCVNMPYKSAAELYEMIEPGTPVLIY